MEPNTVPDIGGQSDLALNKIQRKAYEVLCKRLQSPWKGQRRPKHFSRRLSAAQVQDQSTSHLFLRASREAWFSYFLVLKDFDNHHYPGQKTEKEAIDAFNALPPEDRAKVAEYIANARVDSTVRAAVQSYMEPHESSETSISSPRDDGPSTLPVSEQRFTAEPATLLGSEPRFGAGPPAILRHQILNNPPAYGVAKVFGDFTSESIRKDLYRDSWTAAVSMTFPLALAHSIDCLMSLAICANQVDHFARVLFGAHIDIYGESREVVLPGGSRIIGSEMVLTRTIIEAIPKDLGATVDLAVRGSSLFIEEEKQGALKTRCVWITIPQNHSLGALINCNLGLMEGNMIRGMLWPESG